MSEPAITTPPSRRRLWILVAVIVVLMFALSGGWYWAAGKMDEAVTTFSKNAAQQGRHLECAGQSVRGFPFRLGVHCDSVSYADPAGGITVSGSALRSAAQLYRPGHVVAELDPPYDISVPGLVPMTLDWENLRSSARVSTDSLQRFSLVAESLNISANDFGIRSLLGKLAELQFHARPGLADPEKDIQIALSGDRWVIEDGGSGGIEPLSFSLQGEMTEAYAILKNGGDLLSHIRANGGSGNLQGFEVKTADGGRVLVSGPAEVDRRGLLSGDFTLEFDDPQKLVSYGQSVFPPLGEALAQWNQYLQSFAKAADGRVKIRNLRISVDAGKIRLGFIDLGEIPPLF